MRKSYEIPIPEEKLEEAVLRGIEEGRLRRGGGKKPSGGQWKPLLTAAAIILCLLLARFMRPDVLQRIFGGKSEVAQVKAGAETGFDLESQEEKGAAESSYYKALGITVRAADIYCCEDVFLIGLEIISEEPLLKQVPEMNHLVVSGYAGWEDSEGCVPEEGYVETLLTGGLQDENTFYGVMSLPIDYVSERLENGSGEEERNFVLDLERLRVMAEGGDGNWADWLGSWELYVPVGIEPSRNLSHVWGESQTSWGEILGTPLAIRGVAEKMNERSTQVFVDGSGKYLSTFFAGEGWEEWIPVRNIELSSINMYLITDESGSLEKMLSSPDIRNGKKLGELLGQQEWDGFVVYQVYSMESDGPLWREETEQREGTEPVG